MTTIGDTHEFRFPTEPTRREKQTFSKHAGITFTTFATLAQQAQESPEEGTAAFAAVWDDAEPALILIAAQRLDPATTYDKVMDTNGWSLAAEEEEAAAPLVSTSSESTPQEMPETTESTNSQT